MLPALGVCVLGLIALFLLHDRAEECVEVRRCNWVALAAITGGFSIWCTHFLSMLAYRSPLPLGLDLPLTLTSIAAPYLTIWIALGHIRRRRDLARCLAVGGLTMIGIGAMHLIGMAALHPISMCGCLDRAVPPCPSASRHWGSSSCISAR